MNPVLRTFPFLRRLGVDGAFTRNVTSTFLVQVLSLFFGITTSAIVARFLGPEGKGLVALALLVPGMLGLFLSGGIETSNVYFAGSRRLDISTLAANSVAFAILATISGTVIVGGLVATGWLERLMPGVPVLLILFAMLEFPLRVLLRYFSTILQGLQRIITVNLVNLSDFVLTLILTIAFVVGLRMGSTGAVLASVGAVAVNLVIVSFLLRRLGGVFKPVWNRAVMRSTLSFGLRGYIGNVFQFFNYRLDMLLVNFFLDPAGVGIYTVSVRLAELLWNLPNAVGFVIFPKAAATRPERMNTFTPRVFRITMILTTLGAIGLALLGKPFIQLIYSSAFTTAYIPMLALLPGVVLLGGAKVLTNEIAGRGYPHYNSITTGISLVLTVVLDLLLIPRYGVLGASLASSVSYSVIFVAAIGFYRVVSRRAGAVKEAGDPA
jgi:O-antigen/teichoic acid export membrane protein